MTILGVGRGRRDGLFDTGTVWTLPSPLLLVLLVVDFDLSFSPGVDSGDTSSLRRLCHRFESFLLRGEDRFSGARIARAQEA